MDNRSISHTRWKCQYHIVFIPKYRKKVLYGKVREDVREIISTLCRYKDVEIIAGAVCIDHVHLSVAIPPKLSVSNFIVHKEEHDKQQVINYISVIFRTALPASIKQYTEVQK